MSVVTGRTSKGRKELSGSSSGLDEGKGVADLIALYDLLAWRTPISAEIQPLTISAAIIGYVM
jgi:hypothetical protein